MVQGALFLTLGHLVLLGRDRLDADLVVVEGLLVEVVEVGLAELLLELLAR